MVPLKTFRSFNFCENKIVLIYLLMYQFNMLFTRILFIRYLYKNKIENMETRVFQNLTNLEQLYLHSNKIQSLNLEMFQGLNKLERL